MSIRRVVVCLVAIVMSGLMVSEHGRAATSPAAQEPPSVKKSIDAWVEMWNTYDLNQVDRLFLQDDRVSYFSSEKEGAILGIEAVREHHRGFGFVEGGKKQENKLWVDDLHIIPLGSTTVVTGIWYFQRPTGRTQRGPVTFVYLLQGQEYRLAHMHFANYPGTNPSPSEGP